MTDTWLVRIVDKNQRLLGAFHAKESPLQCQSWRTKGFATLAHWLDLIPSTFTCDGLPDEVQIFKNSRLYSICKDSSKLRVFAGDIESRPVMIDWAHIHFVNNLSPGTTRLDPPEGCPVEIKTLELKKCTCGVKFSGGLCSDWCDLVRKQ